MDFAAVIQIRSSVKLKCARNWLMSISIRIPVEILGHIFVLTTVQEQGIHFEGLKKRSYNFCLVCHHWSEVASNTPELWRCWGNTLKDWEKWHFRTGSLVDLVLDHEPGPGGLSIPLSSELSGRLKDCANQDMIRQIHLHSYSPDPLGSILSSVTPDGEDVQEKSIESFIIHTSSIPKELSKFFARLRLPLLWHFEIIGRFETLSWHHIESSLTSTCLTTFSLKAGGSSLCLTTPQLLSILNANPNLQDLTLVRVLPHKIEDVGIAGQHLSHLRKIYLWGKFRSVFQLLELLDPPALLDYVELVMEKSTSSDIHQMLVPYLKEFFQDHNRFKEPLEVTISTHYHVLITIILGGEGPIRQYARFSMGLINQVDKLDLQQVAINLTKCVPQERVEILEMDCTFGIPEDFFNVMPKLSSLRLEYFDLLDGFMGVNSNGQPSGWKPLPSLQSLHLEQIFVKDGDWQPLLTYL